MSIMAQIKEIEDIISSDNYQFLFDFGITDFQHFDLEVFINLTSRRIEIYPLSLPNVKYINLCDFEMWMNDVKAGLDRHDLMIIWNRHLETLAGL